MPEIYNNKVVYNHQTLIDLTADTISAEKILTGFTAHLASGAPVTGTCDFDANTQDASALVGDVLQGSTFYGQGVKKTGTMPNNGAVTGTIATKEQVYTVPQGYHDGSGKVAIDALEQNKIIPSNIKRGIQILGITGDYSGEEISAGIKEVTASAVEQTVLPSPEYDYLAQVTVHAMPYVETLNPQGGYTVTIG